MTPRRHRCTECGQLGATQRVLDAADAVHWFHPECFARLAAWLRGENEEQTP